MTAPGESELQNQGVSRETPNTGASLGKSENIVSRETFKIA
ncbi:MAG TPA: hypothetical protein VLD65_06215 [Anaerolineales bacterium]|nr:hypothetical protein [Anaerolineales bacterium]